MSIKPCSMTPLKSKGGLIAGSVSGFAVLSPPAARASRDKTFVKVDGFILGCDLLSKVWFVKSKIFLRKK